MDAQTYKDLEIFEATPGQKSFFKLLNYTQTQGGEDTLKARWLHPFNKTDDILQTQEAVRYFMMHYHSWQQCINSKLIRNAEKYVHTNINTLQGNGKWEIKWNAVNFRMRYPDEFFFLKNGLTDFIELLRNIEATVKLCSGRSEEHTSELQSQR